MVCKRCGCALPTGSKFCPQCGEAVVKECPKCGAVLAETVMFCPCCGTKVSDDETALESLVRDNSDSSNAETDLKASRETKKKVWWIIPALIIIILIFIPKGSKEAMVKFSHINISETGWGNLTVTLSATNFSDTAIKNLEIAFMAWDENGLPVLIPDNPIYYDTGYLYEGSFDAVNIPANGTEEIQFDIWCELYDIRHVMPVVVSYENYNGKVWKNSKMKSLKKMAGEQMKNVEGIYTME